MFFPCGMMKAISGLFDKRVKHQRIKRFGEYSTIRTAIREEPIKLAQSLRGEKKMRFLLLQSI
jgi:hypothetical protein